MKYQKTNFNSIPFYSGWMIERAINTGFVLCAFIVIGYCVWTLDRGFDITDESYYLLLAMHADSVKVFISAQQWITAGLWSCTGSIAMFRAAGMFLLIAGAAILSMGVFSAGVRFGLLTNRFVSKAVVSAGSLVCAMLYASTINLSPSYNLLASAGAYAAAGMTLLAINTSNSIYKYVLFAFAGFALGVEALSKLSAGISTCLLLLFWLAIFERSLVNKLLGTVVMFISVATCAVFYLLINTTISEAAQALEQGMYLFRMVQVESVSVRLVRYSTEFFKYFLTTLKVFVTPMLAIIIYTRTRNVIFVIAGLTLLVIILLFGSLDAGSPVFLIKNFFSDSYLYGGYRRYDIQITAVLAMLIIALFVSVPVWSKNRDALVLFSGLILLPYSVAMGTGNAMFTQIIDSLAPWGVMMAVFVVSRYPDNYSKIPVSLIAIIFMVTIVLQIITSSLRPYGLPLTLLKHDKTATVGNLGDVKVDAGTFVFLKDMKTAVKECSIKSGSPFYGLYNIPGVALALQVIPVISPWLNNKAQAEFVLNRASQNELESAVVAFQMTNTGELPLLPEQLESFPSGYRYCGMGTYPYSQQKIEIWYSLAK